MTNSIAETMDNDALFLIGTNTSENHPVIATLMKRAKNKGAKIVVADPRRIEMADWADVFLQLKPGTNIALINGMAHVIIQDGLLDEEFIQTQTEDFEELKEFLQSYTPEWVSGITGVPAADIVRAAHIYGEAESAGIYYAMGITQHATGTNGVMALSNLAMLTGNLGKPNGGINPLRGQNNVQGACDMGCLPADLPGYQKVFKPEVQSAFEAYWGRPLSGKVGLTLPEVISSVLKDEVRLLWVFGENPVVSDPDTNHVRHAMEHVDFLIVNDLFLTETAEYADVVLPAASFAEKNGTFTNTERRVQRVRQAVSPRGQSRPDWRIFMEVMNRLGYDKTYVDESRIFEEIAQVTPSYRGIDYSRIDQVGLQWPCPSAEHPGTKFLHQGKIARGRGLFVPVDYKEPMEPVDVEYPYILTTGRILYQYHTMSMTGKTEGLNELTGSSYVEIAPETASRHGLATGDRIKLYSRRGEISTTVRVTDIIEDEVIFMPFHFAEGANVLTNTALDPIAKIPELKVCAVRLEKEKN
ncbi:Formate dehydrogenase H [anaerobic digester metagenome]